MSQLVKLRRRMEMQRLRTALPWASDRELARYTEQNLHGLDLRGCFAANKTFYRGANLGMGRSPAIWADFGWEQIREDTNLGDILWENWLGVAFTAAASNLAYLHGSSSGGWQAFIPTGGAITGYATDYPNGPGSQSNALGTIKLSAGTTAHNSLMLQLGKASGSYGVSSTSGALPKLYFEARVRFNLAGAANTAAYYVGMATPGLATANNTLFNSSDALITSSQNYIGFTSVNSGTINGMYAKGAAQTNVGTAGAIPTTLTQWTKLGFVFDPFNVQPLRYYQDGTLLYAATSLPSTNWPTNVALTPTIVYQLGGSGTTDILLDVDWIAVGTVLQVE